ncbi:MAG: YcxB family protein [Lachnospiraceae bacterium]|nr:YcxB family protein [Lachnospiraceae bacterium]
MEFKYRYKIKASDVWQVRMYYAYASYTAVVNIVCIFASIALIVALWRTSALWFRLLMLVFLSLFTVIQPLFIYYSSVKQVAEMKDDIELTFNERGMEITVSGKHERHPWKDVISVTIRPTLVIVYTDASHGYILTNRVLKDTRKSFVEFVKKMRSR